MPERPRTPLEKCALEMVPTFMILVATGSGAPLRGAPDPAASYVFVGKYQTIHKTIKKTLNNDYTKLESIKKIEREATNQSIKQL